MENYLAKFHLYDVLELLNNEELKTIKIDLKNLKKENENLFEIIKSELQFILIY